MEMASIVMIPALLFTLALLAGGVYLFVLIVRALRKYIRSGEARREKAETCRSLGEAIRTHRMRCQMTQEFVAEALGVSARRSAGGRPARRTPAPPTCWPWPSSSASRRRSCCVRQRREKCEVLKMRRERYRSGGVSAAKRGMFWTCPQVKRARSL